VHITVRCPVRITKASGPHQVCVKKDRSMNE
jgi:hypothetical protein